MSNQVWQEKNSPNCDRMQPRGLCHFQKKCILFQWWTNYFCSVDQVDYLNISSCINYLVEESFRDRIRKTEGEYAFSFHLATEKVF